MRIVSDCKVINSLEQAIVPGAAQVCVDASKISPFGQTCRNKCLRYVAFQLNFKLVSYLQSGGIVDANVISRITCVRTDWKFTVR